MLRVFPAAPEQWSEVAFESLRGQGAFLVSAKKEAGVTKFVKVESLVGSSCVLKTDIVNTVITIDGVPARAKQVKRMADGLISVDLQKGQTVVLTPVLLENADLTITPFPVPESDRNIFGLNQKSKARIPGHRYYHKESDGK